MRHRVPDVYNLLRRRCLVAARLRSRGPVLSGRQVALAGVANRWSMYKTGERGGSWRPSRSW